MSKLPGGFAEVPIPAASASQTYVTQNHLCKNGEINAAVKRCKVMEMHHVRNKRGEKQSMDPLSDVNPSVITSSFTLTDAP